MEKDLDIKLYNEYLKGEKQAFELLYNKYKDKIQYFIYNIVKDYEKSEDITQEVFIYILQNPVGENYSFKYYIYLVAKVRPKFTKENPDHNALFISERNK